ncbi:CAI-1 autoinducer sensor kinase/phosphatase CqsS [Elysia marginata]|uniref:CAI-1 autoinducer sensor kinase/phosphatase CqsS n=1 Tax=Elysia marginata TaxID=1093978 RepID=A0AAV4GA99_9GAST|nr:CAI-1 autoinducer sensor kinase/phosphatase CqsS [Elysia marginata]
MIFTSADLQKVIMLPRIDTFKAAIFFTKRLVVFNKTFAELGCGSRDFAAVWHKAIAGRQDEDIASTFYAFLHKVRDTKKIVFWLDNCGAQNKN